MDEPLRNAVAIGLDGFFMIAALAILISLVDTGIRLLVKFKKIRRMRKNGAAAEARKRLVIPYTLTKQNVDRGRVDTPAQWIGRNKRRA